MEDDIDIYEDLPSFEAKESEKYKEEINNLSQKCNEFEQANTELRLKIDELSDSNKSLCINLSSLLKTAKAEISRKDRMITELRQKLDNMAFRRTGYARSKVQEYSKDPAKNSTYTPSIRQEPFPVHSESVPYQDNTYTPFTQQDPFPVASTYHETYQEFEEKIEDPEQKYEPEKIATTVFGERLRRKIQMEDEVEKIQKEEAKRVMLENTATTVKAEVEMIQENENSSNLIKNELPEVSNNFVEETVLPIKSAPASIATSLNSYEEDERNLAERRELSNKVLGKRFHKDIQIPQNKRRRIEDERYHSDDTRYFNGNAHYDDHFNQESNDNSRNTRNIAKHISRRRGSDNRENIERDRRAIGERSKSNHRSRSRSPDRRYVEKRADRHRTDKYRAYMDTYEKRRNNGLNKINPYSNKFSRGAYDLRIKIDHRIDSKIGVRGEYNTYKNSKFEDDRKREKRESPPPAKLRSRSNGRIRDRLVDKIGGGRSKSSNRLANIWDEASESKNLRTRSKKTKTSVDDRRNVDDEFKLEKSPRTSYEKEITNKQVVSSALLPQVYGKIDTDKKHNSPVLIPDISEKKETDKQHISITQMPEGSEKNETDKQHMSILQMPEGSENQGTDEQHISTSLLPSDLTSIPKSDEVTENIRKQRKGVKTKSKDLAIVETKDRDFEAKSEMEKESCNKEVTNMQIISSGLLPNTSEKETTNQILVSTAQLSNVSSSTEKTCEVPEELKKQVKIARRRSKDSESTIHVQKICDSDSKTQISSRESFEKEVTHKLLVSLELLPDACKKDVRNQLNDSTTQLPSISVSTPESYGAPEISKKQKDVRRKSKDSESTITEEKNRDPESKSRIKLSKTCEKEVKSKQLDSLASLPESFTKDSQNQKSVATNQSLDGLIAALGSNQVPEEIKRERKSPRRKSKDPETLIAEEKNHGPKAKSRLASRKNSEKDLLNKQITAPLSDDFKDNVTNHKPATSTKLPNDITSAERSSGVPEERKKQRKSSRTKSKNPATKDHKDCNPKPNSTLTQTSCGKEVPNKKLASTTELSDVINFASASCDAPEVKKQQKIEKRELKDPKPTVTEQKDCSLKLKSQSPTKTNSEKTKTNEHLVSYVPTVEDLVSKLESDGIYDGQKALNDQNTKPLASLQITPNTVDNLGKRISSVSENNAEISSAPLETFTDVGSASFREEKIENIEKFIQNYQDDEDLCCRFSKRRTEDFDCGNKSFDSTRSILDTLSMDIDVVANCKPEDGVLDNSLTSEQLLLESLSTPVKKKNSPSPPLRSSHEIKPPPLPPNSPPEQIKQPPLPLNSLAEEKSQPPLPPDSPPEEPKQPPLPPDFPPEEPKQPPLPSDSPPEEMEIQSLPLLPSSDEKQHNPPPFLSLNEKKQELPSLSSPDEVEKNLWPLPSADEKKQNFPLIPLPETNKQNSPPLPAPEEKKLIFPSLSSSEEKERTLPSPSPNEDKQSLLSLSPPSKNPESSSALSSSNNNQLSLLLSHETEHQELPSLSIPNEEKQSMQILASLNDKKHRLSSPHPSPERIKRRLLSSVVSSDEKKRPSSPPLPTAQERTLVPVSKDETKPDLFVTLASQKKTDQPLSSTSVDKTKRELLVEPMPIEKNDLPSAQIEGEHSEPSAVQVQNQKEEPLFSQFGSKKGNFQSSSLTLLTQKDDVPFSLPPVRLDKENLQQSELLVSSKKVDLPLSLPEIPNDKTNASSSHSSAPGHKKSRPPSLVDENSQPPASVDKDRQLPAAVHKNPQLPAAVHKEPQPPDPTDEKSQLSGSVNKKLQPPALADKKSQLSLAAEKKSQPSVPADKKSQFSVPADKKSQPSVPVDKKSQPSVPADKKSHSSVPADKKSQPSVPANRKSQASVLADTKSQASVPVDEKSQASIPADKKSQLSLPADKEPRPSFPAEDKSELAVPVIEESLLPAPSKKLDPPLVPTEKNLLLSASSENKNPQPAPTHKTNKISETKEISTRKPRPEKPRPEKVILKAISRRHKIPCTSIVSRYSRKTRNMVLTDSDASLRVVKSNAPSDNESNNNAKIEIKTSSGVTKEAQIILKQLKKTNPEETSSGKSIINPISKDAKPEKLSGAVTIHSTENTMKIKSDIPNATSELQTTKKVDSLPEIIPSTLSKVEIPNPEQHQHNSGESQSQLEPKQETSSNLRNQESHSQLENKICPHFAESRGARLVSKTIATLGSEDVSSSVVTNQKKPLLKEKENQSKQAGKPCKITVVARRRRPVNLEDSSTATTLVTSAQETNCDRLSKINSIKITPLNSEKLEIVQPVSDLGSKGRKRRSADK